MATLSTDQLQSLQDGISASVQILLQAYDNCSDPEQSAQLMSQVSDLSRFMGQLEKNIFHQQTVDAATAATAFSDAKGYTAQLTEAGKNLEKVADIVAAGAKVVGAVTKIVGFLA